MSSYVKISLMQSGKTDEKTRVYAIFQDSSVPAEKNVPSPNLQLVTKDILKWFERCVGVNSSQSLR